MSVWDQIGDNIDEWLEGFKNSPTVKALGVAFDTFSYLNSAYKFWMQIFFPEPNYGALILEALEALREDIHDLFTDLGNARAEKLVRFFRETTTRSTIRSTWMNCSITPTALKPSWQRSYGTGTRGMPIGSAKCTTW